jgi:hypothetical protein
MWLSGRNASFNQASPSGRVRASVPACFIAPGKRNTSGPGIKALSHNWEGKRSAVGVWLALALTVNYAKACKGKIAFIGNIRVSDITKFILN